MGWWGWRWVVLGGLGHVSHARSFQGDLLQGVGCRLAGFPFWLVERWGWGWSRLAELQQHKGGGAWAERKHVLQIPIHSGFVCFILDSLWGGTKTSISIQDLSLDWNRVLASLCDLCTASLYLIAMQRLQRDAEIWKHMRQNVGMRASMTYKSPAHSCQSLDYHLVIWTNIMIVFFKKKSTPSIIGELGKMYL